jgi:hypothetical protein
MVGNNSTTYDQVGRLLPNLPQSGVWRPPPVMMPTIVMVTMKAYCADTDANPVSAIKIHHEHLFFLEDGRPISDPEITRWRWSESIKALNIRRRGPYPCATFLRDLATHVGQEFALGCEAART